MLPPFGWTAVFTQWQFAPVVTAATALSAVGYAWGVLRVARRHPSRPWPAWRTAAFAAGLVVIVIAIESGVGRYDELLFWDHMIEHLLLIMVAPPLLIAGQPITLLLHASRNPLHTWTKRALRSTVVTALTSPVFGVTAYAAAVVIAHLTAVAALIERNPAVHDAEHAVFLIVGYLFFLPVIGTEPIRWRLSYPMRFAVLVMTMPVDTFTGVVLGYGTAGSPAVPIGPRPAWAPGPVQDLHVGGAVMWIGGDAIMFALMMVVFAMWSRDERAGGVGWLERARRASLAHGALEQATAAGRAGAKHPHAFDDDDEKLAAYNAYLAGLAALGTSEPGTKPGTLPPHGDRGEAPGIRPESPA